MAEQQADNSNEIEGQDPGQTVQGNATAPQQQENAEQVQAQKEADERLLRESNDAAAATQDSGLDGQMMLEMIMAVIDALNGDKHALANIMEKFKDGAPEETTPDNSDQDVAQDQPSAEQSTAAVENTEAEADNAPDATEPQDTQPEQSKGYVNEGLGPLLTVVEKPVDPPVSPLIALALGQDLPGDQNILGGAFNNNAAYEVGNAQVIQVPFAPEVPVVDPQAQSMEVANVQPTQPEQEDLVNVQVLNMR